MLLLIAMSIVACSSEAPDVAPATAAETRFQQWSLPERLNEISGLALTADERLLAVTDELAVVYEIDYDDGHLVKAFAFGNPPLRGDFEGITVRDNIVWLMTSDGTLLAAAEGDNGESMSYQSYDTGLGNTCELEGLTVGGAERSLVLICKEARRNADLQIFVWNPDTGNKDRIDLQEKKMADAAGEKDINPSGIAVDPDSGQYNVVAARQNVVLGLLADGSLAGVIMRLDSKRHRQAEGIAITQDGRVLIADEAGNGRARLAVYRMDHGNKNN